MNYDAFLAKFDVKKDDIEAIKAAERNFKERLKVEVEKKKNNPDYDMSNAASELEWLRIHHDTRANFIFGQEVKKFIIDNNLDKDEAEELYKAFNEKMVNYNEQIIKVIDESAATAIKAYDDAQQGKDVDIDNLFKDDKEQDIEEDDTITVEEEKEANSIVHELFEVGKAISETRKRILQTKKEEFLKSAEEIYREDKKDKATIKELKKDYQKAIERVTDAQGIYSANIQSRREDAECQRNLKQLELLGKEEKFRDFKKVAPLVAKFEKANKEYLQKIEKLDEKIKKMDNPEKKNNLVEQRNALVGERKKAIDDFKQTDTGKEYVKHKNGIKDTKNSIKEQEQKIRDLDKEQKEFDNKCDERRTAITEAYKNKLPAKQEKKGFITKIVGALQHRFGNKKEDAIKESLLKRAITSMDEFTTTIKNSVSEKWEKFTDINQSEILNKMKAHLDERLAKISERAEARQQNTQQNDTPDRA